MKRQGIKTAGIFFLLLAVVITFSACDLFRDPDPDDEWTLDVEITGIDQAEHVEEFTLDVEHDGTPAEEDEIDSDEVEDGEITVAFTDIEGDAEVTLTIDNDAIEDGYYEEDEDEVELTEEIDEGDTAEFELEFTDIDEPGESADVGTVSELEDALASEDTVTITFTDDIGDGEDEFELTRDGVTIDGDGYELDGYLTLGEGDEIDVDIEDLDITQTLTIDVDEGEVVFEDGELEDVDIDSVGDDSFDLEDADVDNELTVDTEDVGRVNIDEDSSVDTFIADSAVNVTGGDQISTLIVNAEDVKVSGEPTDVEGTEDPVDPELAEVDVDGDVEDVQVTLGTEEDDALAELADEIVVADELDVEYDVDIEDLWEFDDDYEADEAGEYDATADFSDELPSNVVENDVDAEVTATVEIVEAALDVSFDADDLPDQETAPYEWDVDFEVTAEETEGYETEELVVSFGVVDDEGDAVVDTVDIEADDQLEDDSATFDFEIDVTLEEDDYTATATASAVNALDDTQTDSFTIAAAEEANFAVEITDYDDDVEEDETVEVDYEIENTGDEEDTQDITFSVDNVQEDSEDDVTLDSDETFTGTFEYSDLDAGDEYDMEVASDDDSDSVTVTVQDLEADPDPDGHQVDEIGDFLDAVDEMDGDFENLISLTDDLIDYEENDVDSYDDIEIDGDVEIDLNTYEIEDFEGYQFQIGHSDETEMWDGKLTFSEEDMLVTNTAIFTNVDFDDDGEENTITVTGDAIDTEFENVTFESAEKLTILTDTALEGASLEDDMTIDFEDSNATLEIDDSIDVGNYDLTLTGSAVLEGDTSQEFTGTGTVEVNDSLTFDAIEFESDLVLASDVDFQNEIDTNDVEVTEDITVNFADSDDEWTFNDDVDIDDNTLTLADADATVDGGNNSVTGDADDGEVDLDEEDLLIEDLDFETHVNVDADAEFDGVDSVYSIDIGVELTLNDDLDIDGGTMEFTDSGWLTGDNDVTVGEGEVDFGSDSVTVSGIDFDLDVVDVEANMWFDDVTFEEDIEIADGTVELTGELEIGSDAIMYFEETSEPFEGNDNEMSGEGETILRRDDGLTVSSVELSLSEIDQRRPTTFDSVTLNDTNVRATHSNSEFLGIEEGLKFDGDVVINVDGTKGNIMRGQNEESVEANTGGSELEFSGEATTIASFSFEGTGSRPFDVVFSNHTALDDIEWNDEVTVTVEDDVELTTSDVTIDADQPIVLEDDGIILQADGGDVDITDVDTGGDDDYFTFDLENFSQDIADEAETADAADSDPTTVGAVEVGNYQFRFETPNTVTGAAIEFDLEEDADNKAGVTISNEDTDVLTEDSITVAAAHLNVSTQDELKTELDEIIDNHVSTGALTVEIDDDGNVDGITP